MKISGLSVLSFVWTNVAFGGAQTEESTGIKWDIQHARDLQTECPNTFTPDDMGFPTFQCNIDCECTMEPYTFKENVAESAGADFDCFRCAKPSGADCDDDFECFGLNRASCNDGICGSDQCPNTATVSNTGIATSFCTFNEICECTVDGFTVKEDVSSFNQTACFHCSKPNGASCEEDHECIVLGSVCIDGTCNTEQCPNTATVEGGLTTSSCQPEVLGICECTIDPYTIKEDLTGGGCFHCAKPAGSECIEDHECVTTTACNNGFCGQRQCPNSADVDEMGAPQYDCEPSGCECSIGEYTEKEGLAFPGVEVQCFRCAKPDGGTCLNDVECLTTSTCEMGFCSEPQGGDGFQCPRTASMEGLVVVSQCSLDSSCECTSDDFTVKEDITGNGCFHCSKPDGAGCVADDECLFFFNRDESGSECYDGICGPLRCALAENSVCTPYECVCVEPNPVKETRTVDDTECYTCSPSSTEEPGEDCGLGINEFCGEESEDCCEPPFICSEKGINRVKVCSPPRIRQRPSVIGGGRGGQAGKVKAGLP